MGFHTKQYGVWWKKVSFTWNLIALYESRNYSCGIRNDNCHISWELLLVSTSRQAGSIPYANKTESDSPAVDGGPYRGANLLIHINYKAFINSAIVFIKVIS